MTTPAQPDDFTTWFSAQLDRDEQLIARSDGFNPGAYIERAPFDIEAKRQILAAYMLADEQGRHPHGRVFTYHATGLLIALKHLATAYEHRPGYREEWRP